MIAKRSLALIAAVSIFSGFALAEDLTEAEILSRLHQSSSLMSQMGKTAGDNSQTEGVRAYGDTLEKDYQEFDDSVVELLQKKGLPLTPPEPKSDAEKAEWDAQKATLEKLSTLVGAEFDGLFLTTMAADHDKAVTRLTDWTGEHGDTETSHLIKAFLPSIKEHLATAQKLQEK